MSIPPAWHPDPTGRHDHRWWDGTRWTEHVADAGVSAVDPIEDGGGPDGGGADAGEASARETSTEGTQQPSGWTTPEGQAADVGGAWGTQQAGAYQGAGTGWPEQGAGTGWPAQGAGWPEQGDPATSTDGMAVAAGIIGIVSLVTSIFLLGAFSGVVAIVLGAIAMSRVKRSGRKGRGMAITGLVTGILAVVIGILLVVVGFAMFREIGWGPFQEYAECMEEVGDEEICTERLEDDLPNWFQP